MPVGSAVLLILIAFVVGVVCGVFLLAKGMLWLGWTIFDSRGEQVPRRKQTIAEFVRKNPWPNKPPPASEVPHG